MSCKERVLLSRLVAGIRSNDLRSSSLCMKDLTLENAVQGSLCQGFLAETGATRTKNRCVIEATHVLPRKLRKD